MNRLSSPSVMKKEDSEQTTEEDSNTPQYDEDYDEFDDSEVGGRGGGAGFSSVLSEASSKGSGGGGSQHHAMTQLTQKEDRMVTRSKVVVALVLLLATACVATVTYLYTKNEEIKDFQTRVRSVEDVHVNVCECLGDRMISPNCLPFFCPPSYCLPLTQNSSKTFLIKLLQSIRSMQRTLSHHMKVSRYI